MSLEPSRVLISAKDPDAAVKTLRDAGLEPEVETSSDGVRAGRETPQQRLNNTKTRRWMAGVLCPTTDRTGAVGYVAGDYRMDFNGTSSATPHVAGLAALLISVAPRLTNVEVRAIIESTADKVGVVAYAADPLHPNGTWNQEMGYGRINVLEAVRLVRKRCEVEIKRLFFEEKVIVPEELGKLRHFKEKERIDEIKGRLGFENPEIFDPRIYERLVERLDRLEKIVLQGKPFIRPEERPDVGRPVAGQARRTNRTRKTRS